VFAHPWAVIANSHERTGTHCLLMAWIGLEARTFIVLSVSRCHPPMPINRSAAPAHQRDLVLLQIAGKAYRYLLMGTAVPNDHFQHGWKRRVSYTGLPTVLLYCCTRTWDWQAGVDYNVTIARAEWSSKHAWKRLLCPVLVIKGSSSQCNLRYHWYCCSPSHSRYCNVVFHPVYLLGIFSET